MTRRIALVGLSWISAGPARARRRTRRSARPSRTATPRPWRPSRSSSSSRAATSRRPRGTRSATAGRGRYPGLTVYDDYAEMLRTERPEFVAVVTPDHLHRGVVEVAIEAGARGIFCEKPIATTLEDADAIVAAVQAAGVTMNVNYTRRWFPEFVEARRMVRDGEIGKLSQIVVEMGGPRSMLFRNHTHAHRPGQLPGRFASRCGSGRSSSPGSRTTASPTPVTAATIRPPSPAATTTSPTPTASAPT